MLLHPWLRKLSTFMVILSAAHCASVKKPVPPATPTSDLKPSPGLETYLTDEGECSQPSFSPDGGRLIYVCANRGNHTLGQTYERNLATGQERRVTFNIGQTSGPSYHPKLNMITYASSTDELKEQAPRSIPDPTPSKLPADYQSLEEVYVHDLNGLDIARVSKHPGFDGEAQFHRDGTLTYTRALAENLEIVSIHPYSGVTQVLKRLGKNVSHYVSSADGKIVAWMDWSSDFQSSRLKLEKTKSKPVELKADSAATKADLYLSADGKYLFWSQIQPNGRSALWVLNTQNLCSRNLLESTTSNLRHPVITPDGKSLAYTVMAQSRSRIAWRTFEPPSDTCPAQQ